MGKLVVTILASLLWMEATGVRVQVEDDMNAEDNGEDMDAEDVGALTLSDSALEDSKPRDADYWLETGALERCVKSRIRRWAEKVVAIPVGFVITTPAALLSIMALTIASQTHDNSTEYSAARSTQAKKEGWTAFWITVPLIPLSMIHAQKVASFGVNQMQILMGANGHHPACCCKKGPGCAIIGSTHLEWGIQTKVTCPAGWEHDATQCTVPEVLTYQNTTVSGCACRQDKEPICAGDKLYRGHAWCEVENTAACGFKFRSLMKMGKRWDFCRFAKQTMFQGSVVGNNTALSSFVPNVHSKSFESKFFNMNPRSSKTFVNGLKGVAIAKGPPSSQCYAGIPVETLDGCAQKCLQEGAPNAKTMEGQEETWQMCTAMAYNRQTRLCVRLPAMAIDADFTPYMKTLDSKGWQNFRIA